MVPQGLCRSPQLRQAIHVLGFPLLGQSPLFRNATQIVLVGHKLLCAGVRPLFLTQSDEFFLKLLVRQGGLFGGASLTLQFGHHQAQA